MKQKFMGGEIEEKTGYLLIEFGLEVEKDLVHGWIT
jgi:hypothetical protein